MFDLCQRLRVDDIESAWLSMDPDVDFPAVARERQVVRMARERNPLDFPQGLAVHGNDGVVRLDGDKDPATVARSLDAVALFNALDLRDDLVGHRIDDADGIPCTIGLKD